MDQHMDYRNRTRSEFMTRTTLPTTLLTPKHVLRIASWNVQTLYETRKATLVAREMTRYNIEVLGLSEVRWLSSGSMKLNTGHQLLYSGLDEGNDHRSGVGLMLTKRALKSLMEWEPINDRIITARFHCKIQNLTIVQCYAPTNTADQEDKQLFYRQLQNVFNKVHKRDIILVMGDLNAKVGQDNTGREYIMGKEGVGTMNENGELFADFCQMNDLVIGGTVFPHRDIHKTTWKSPDGFTENQIDHITISRRWRRSMFDVRAHRGADVGSDHSLLIAKMRIRIAKVKNNNAQRQNRFDVAKLKSDNDKKDFTVSLFNRFEILSNLENISVEDTWNTVKQTFTQSCEEMLGFRKREYKSWISQDTIRAIENRRACKQKLIQAKTRSQKQTMLRDYQTKNKAVKRGARKDKREFIDRLANNAQAAAEKRNFKELYDITRQLSGKKMNTNRPVRCKAGNLLSKPGEQLERWREHFDELLNGTPLDSLPELEGNNELEINTEPPSLIEIITAIKQIKCGKAPGPDNIPPEALKADPRVTAKILLELFKQIWTTEVIPDDWKTGYIVKLPKKGNLTECKNWRGIQLLSLPSKIFTRIILNRIKMAVDSILRDEQAGFRPGRSCTDQIATLRIIIEQSNEWQSPLYINFIDFKKAFDMVDRNVIWKVLRHYGIPNKIIAIIQNLYENTRCQVIHNIEISKPFDVNTGVRQGCLLSPILFSMIIDWIMKTANKTPRGIQWNFHKKLEDLDFADDVSLLSHTWEHMQTKTNVLQEVAKSTGLQINSEKTKTMRLNTRNQDQFNLDGQEIENVEHFTYLGSVMDTRGGADLDIKTRVSKARQAFAMLRPIWQNKNLHRNTKLKIFSSNVKSVLLYGAETWRQTKGLEQKLQVFMNSCLRQILRIHWSDRVPNHALWQQSNQAPIFVTLRQRKWKWVGHILRRDHNIAKTALDWNPQGQRRRGRPTTTWRRTLEEDLRTVKMTWGEAKKVARDRDRWRSVVDALCSVRSQED